MPASAIPLDAELRSSLIAYCEENLVLPLHLLRRAIGLPLGEPFLVEVKAIHGSNGTRRMLSILSHLWQRDSQKFDVAAQGIRGHNRLWFAQNRQDIANSGNSTRPEQIPETPWWVCTNCPSNGMEARIEKVMQRMGFTTQYAQLVSSYATHGKGRPWWPHHLKDIDK